MTTFPPPSSRPDAALPPPPPPPPPSPVPVGSPLSPPIALVPAITILLGLGALAQVWFVAAITVRRHAALRWQEGRGGLGAVSTGDHLVESAVIARYGLMVPTAILLAIWSARVVRTNSWLGRRDSTFNPSLAAASWFIPLGNLVLPAVMLTNVWKATDPTLPTRATSADAGEKPTTPLIAAWWACWLGSLLAQILFGATATVKGGDSVRVYRDHLERQVLLAGIGALLTVGAAVLGAIVVSRLSTRQRVAVEARLRGV
jgi:hypothetical protein